VDPNDRTGTKFIGDLAQSWTPSPDRRTQTFKIRPGVNSTTEACSRQGRQSLYDHIIFPPPGVVSSRKEQYRAVEAVEAPTPDTVVFRLKWYEGSFMASLASPWNWIYKADLLARDPRWYEKNVMARALQVRGVRPWLALGGQEEPGLLGQGQALPRRLRAIFIAAASAQVQAVRGERAMIQFRGFTRRTEIPWWPRSATTHRAGEPLELLHPGRDESEQEAVRRQAGPPRAQPRAWTGTRARRRCHGSRSSRRSPASRCRAPVGHPAGGGW